jgi:hypothetical protein
MYSSATSTSRRSAWREFLAYSACAGLSCVYLAGIALYFDAIPRPEPLHFGGRPLGEFLDVEANIKKRSNGCPTMWDRPSQRRQGVLDVFVLLISRELLELGP